MRVPPPRTGVQERLSACRGRTNRIGADFVTPLTTSAFDLPDNLSHKADPALIARDERQFAAIAENLERSIADLSARLDAERRAQGGLGRQALERDRSEERRVGKERRYRTETQ